MNQEEKRPSGESEPSAPSTEPPAPESSGEASREASSEPAPQKPPVDLSCLPAGVVRILKDPGGSLEALHKPGQAALVQGLILGVGSVLLIPIVQLIVVKILFGSAASVPVGDLFRQFLGGVVFLATAVTVGFLFHQTSKNGGRNDWTDQVYAVGSSAIFLLAGVIAAGVFLVFKSEFFNSVAHSCTIAGVLLAAFTYFCGASKLSGLGSSKAVWAAVAAFAAAILVGGLLDFNPASAMPNISFDMGSMQRDLQRSMQDAFRDLGR